MGKISFGQYKPIIISFLIGVTAFTTYKYLSSLKEQYDLTNTISKLNNEVSVLESEKQSMQLELEKKEALMVETAKLKEQLQAHTANMTALSENFAYIQNELDAMKEQVDELKEENTALLREKDEVETRLSQAQAERDALNARLNSVTELKKALKDVRQKMRKMRAQNQERPLKKNSLNAPGNRGFIVKNGKSTFPVKIRIEVTTSDSSE